MNRHRENTRKRRYRGGNGEPVATNSVSSQNSTFKRTVKKIWEGVTSFFGKKEESVANTSTSASAMPAASALAPTLATSAAPPLTGGRRHRRKASKKHRKATKKHRKH